MSEEHLLNLACGWDVAPRIQAWATRKLGGHRSVMRLLLVRSIFRPNPTWQRLSAQS